MKLKHYLPAIVIIFAACSDENDSGLSPEGASAQISSIAGEMNDDVVTMVQSEGVQGALSLVELMENSTEFGRISPYTPDENQAFVQQQVGTIAYHFTTGVADALGEEPQDFIDLKGVYLWNFDLEDFEKVEESDFLVIGFPSEGSTTNNAEFRLTEYTVVEIDQEEWPTAIKADLAVDDVTYINLNLIVNYDSEGAIEAADITLDVLPFSLDLTFSDKEAQSSFLDVALLLEGEDLVGIDVEIEFDSEDKLEPVAISGEVFYRDLKIAGSISDTMMDESVDSNPNDYVDLDLLIADDKVGDIVFVLEEFEDEWGTYEEYVPYVQYSDGTQENLEELLEDVILEIEDLFEDLDDFEG